MKVLFLALVSAVLPAARAVLPFIPRPPALKFEDIAELSAAQDDVGYFEQLIDHKKPERGTFQQRYWWNATFWEGPGSPIVLFTPGEVEADRYTGYLTDRAISGRIAKEIGGAVLMIEHRYWGTSIPTEDLSTKGLQQHTLDNAVADFVNFARRVKLPFDATNSSNAPEAPWVWTGGSYAGNVAAWIEKLSPGTFWAYHSSSAPVEAVYDYWGYFYPIQQGMPKNCSRDFERIIEFVDEVLINGSDSEKEELKKKFLLDQLEHDDDVAAALNMPLGAWQGIQLYSGYSSFFQMCDAIEGVQPGQEQVPGEDGIGLPDALDNYASWWSDIYFPGTCQYDKYPEWDGPLSVGCLDSYNATSPVFSDWSLDTEFNRQWYWMTCNEPFFYWQTGAPEGRPTIVSRLVTPEYYQRQCDLFFPRQGCAAYGSSKGKTAEMLNARTDGWLLTNTTRLVWTNGEFDPWRSASVSSEFRPGGPLRSRPGAPVYLIPGGRHCNDLLMRNGSENEGVGAAIAGVLEQIKTWVAEFYAGGVTRRRRWTPATKKKF